MSKAGLDNRQRNQDGEISHKHGNTLIRTFPNNLTAMLFGYQVKPSFTVQNEAEISKPPEVNFGKPD